MISLSVKVINIILKIVHSNTAALLQHGKLRSLCIKVLCIKCNNNNLCFKGSASMEDDTKKDDLDVSAGGEVICINPFHYVITSEAEMR